MKQGALGWPEQHMVVVLTQWRAGFFDKGKQKAKDQTPGSANDPERDFKYRAGCTLLIDPQEMQIRRVIRTPGTVADEDELDRMRRLPAWRAHSSQCLCAGRGRALRRTPSPSRSFILMGSVTMAKKKKPPARRPRRPRRPRSNAAARKPMAPPAGAVETAARRRRGSHVPHRPRRLLPDRVRGREP